MKTLIAVLAIVMTLGHPMDQHCTEACIAEHGHVTNYVTLTFEDGDRNVTCYHEDGYEHHYYEQAEEVIVEETIEEEIIEENVIVEEIIH